MGFLGEAQLGPSFPPVGVFREYFGFVPRVFRAQGLLPRVIEAEAAILDTVLLKQRVLSRVQKDCIALAVAAAHRNTYCVTTHYRTLLLLGVPEVRLDEILAGDAPADLPAGETALLAYAVKLAQNGWLISRDDVDLLVEGGSPAEAVLETILTAAFANLLCTLSTGLSLEPDFEPKEIPRGSRFPPSGVRPGGEGNSGPYLPAPELSADVFEPFAFLREEFGFVPNVFRAQTLRPDVLEAEAAAIRAVLLTSDVLTRRQKEYILLAVSAANLNTYWVAFQSEILRLSGVPVEDSDRIAADHRGSPLAESDKALLDVAVRLTGAGALRQHGFGDAHILEAVATAAFTCFLNTVQMGAGAVPDFAPHRKFIPRIAHLSVGIQRPSDEGQPVDPDLECVAKVQQGDLNAFEELMNRHHRRVYRTLVGILGNPDEARDAMQDTFLKAFQHLGEFQRRSTFSTWLVSIAGNTGVQRLRERRRLETLDYDDAGSEEGSRPRQLRAWAEDPERLYSRAEMSAIVENGVMGLPAKYRVVLVLRDLEQLPVEEAASALGLGIPAFKARLLRGRLMLREALAPHFSGGARGAAL